MATRADEHAARRCDPNLRIYIGLFPTYHQKCGRAHHLDRIRGELNEVPVLPPALSMFLCWVNVMDVV